MLPRLPRLPAYTPILLHQNPIVDDITIAPPNRRRRSSQRRCIIIRRITPRNTAFGTRFLYSADLTLFIICKSSPREAFSSIHFVFVNLHEIIFVAVRGDGTESTPRPAIVDFRSTTPTSIRTINLRPRFTAILAAVLAIFVVRRCSNRRFREQFFADLELEGADCGGAGDHYANVGFDGGPVADGEVVPGYVVGVGELDEVFEAEDADDCDAVGVVSVDARGSREEGAKERAKLTSHHRGT
jgi:hypothetical protein